MEYINWHLCKDEQQYLPTFWSTNAWTEVCRGRSVRLVGPAVTEGFFVGSHLPCDLPSPRGLWRSPWCHRKAPAAGSGCPGSSKRGHPSAQVPQTEVTPAARGFWRFFCFFFPQCQGTGLIKWKLTPSKQATRNKYNNGYKDRIASFYGSTYLHPFYTQTPFFLCMEIIARLHLWSSSWCRNSLWDD